MIDCVAIDVDPGSAAVWRRGHRGVNEVMVGKRPNVNAGNVLWIVDRGIPMAAHLEPLSIR